MMNKQQRKMVQSQDRPVCFDKAIQDFCSILKIRNWDQFKNSDRIKTFLSPKLKKEITISGNRRTSRPEGCWTASEMELLLKAQVSQHDLKKIQYVKTFFDGTFGIMSKDDINKINALRS